jgi:SAM-dependent methyltransferase
MTSIDPPIPSPVDGVVDWASPVTPGEMYGRWPLSDDEIEAALDESLDPRPAPWLYQLAGEAGIGATSHVLDIGGRDGAHGLELVERLGCRVTSLDPSRANLARGRRNLADQPLGRRVGLGAAVIEAIPARPSAFDAIWCRDPLSHIGDIDQAIGECRRVLAPTGALIVYQTFATSWLEPAEAARLAAGLGVVPRRWSPDGLERAATRAGFTIERTEVVGSQWREAWEEDGSARTSKQLLHAARLIRGHATLVDRFGEQLYKVELSNALWGIYQMIGKLEPRVYVLRR